MNAPSFEQQSLSRGEMQKLIDSPIDTGKRANSVWLPMGKRAQPRAVVNTDSIDESIFPKVSAAERQKISEARRIEKLQEILAYYATTTVPFAQIAAHTKLDLVEVVRAMKARGREA